MKSKAHLKGHPIHPMLVPFPIAFFTGSFLFDLCGALLGKEELWRVSYWLQIAGVLFSLITAVPGFIDFLYAVPPKSSGKKRAAIHGITNVVTMLVFFCIWLYRQTPEMNIWTVIAFDVAGVVLLSIAGWLGGTLTFRNLIGVDTRY